VSRQNWEEERRKRILGKASISVKVRDLNVAVRGTTLLQQGSVRTTLAAAITASVHKTLELAKSGDRWVIVREHTGS
jgi:ketosteroid isomerase-like protein